MKFLEYIGFRTLVMLVGIMPFWLLYRLSDFVYFILFKVAKYRYRVVYENVSKSFPDRTEAERVALIRKFYHHLSDITLESIKAMSMSQRSISRRYVVTNPEVADAYFAAGRSVLFLTSHYGNWEYGMIGLDRHVKHQTVALYLPLTNKYSEHYAYRRRTRFGMRLVAVQHTKEAFADFSAPVAVIMAADQCPSNIERAIRIDFLNHRTACLHGPEAYVKKMKMPALYLRIGKPRRGFYTLTFEELIADPQQNFADGEITRLYFNKLERDIRQQPEFWLWSHRRWKHQLIEN